MHIQEVGVMLWRLGDHLPRLIWQPIDGYSRRSDRLP